MPKSSRALNRPESTFFRTENRAVMGFSQKDLGDVVWSSETSRDPVLLTSRPKTRSTQQTLTRIHPGRTHIAFDDHHLVPDAGLLLPAILARHLGLPQLVDRHLDLGHAPGRAVTGDKMMTLETGPESPDLEVELRQ